MRLKLLPKFVISLVLLGAFLATALSIFSYTTTKERMESEYAKSAYEGCNTIASMLSLEDVKTIISEGGDNTDAYKKNYDLFNKLKKKGDITFLSLVVPDEDSVTFYIDSLVEEMGDDPANQIPYGSDILYVEAASDEKDLENYRTIWNLYRMNTGTKDPVVTDNAYGYNYTMVAPILDENGMAIAEVQYIIDMNDVRIYVRSFLYKMLGISLGVVVLALLAYILFVVKNVTKPIGQLDKFTKDITDSGVFEKQQITMRTGDEIESLSKSFNFMLLKLDDYIQNLTKITAEKERIGAELNVATKIQADMLPSIFPAFPRNGEFDVYASMDPAKEVGGDFYDFFMVDDRHLALVMADVSGKGVPAALFMVISKTLLKNNAMQGISPSEVLYKTNNELCQGNDEMMFVTVWLGILDIETGDLTYANGGHEYPAVMRAGGDFELVVENHDLVLAAMEGVPFNEYSMHLNPGDRLFVYTDGVPEATSTENELYGTDRMLEILNRHKTSTLEEMLKGVRADIDEFAVGAPQFDDITMLGFDYMGAKKVELTVPATDEELVHIQSVIEAELEKNNCNPATTVSIMIAVEEIFVNIAHYAYQNEPDESKHKAIVNILVDGNPKTITMEFIDQGIPYNPLEKEDPDITLSAEERGIGGLGIYMVKQSMDDVRYVHEDGCNKLTLIKTIE